MKWQPTTIRIYDPWKDEWAPAALREGRLELPSFKRSVVVRLER
jgi:hypothetical protein